MKIPIWILSKPGESRYHVHSKQPSEAWVERRRAEGYELLLCEVELPERYNVKLTHVDGKVIPEQKYIVLDEESDMFLKTKEE